MLYINDCTGKHCSETVVQVNVVQQIFYREMFTGSVVQKMMYITYCTERTVQENVVQKRLYE